jgi:hypothetical protein
MKNGIPGKLVAQLKIKKFIGVQSVVAFENKLYVLDTSSPLFGAVLDAPRLFFNLSNNRKTLYITKGSYYQFLHQRFTCR